jgi:hypothetical protein
MVDSGDSWCAMDTTKLPKNADGTPALLWDQAEVVLANERMHFAAKMQADLRAAKKPARPFFLAVGFRE